MVQKPLLLTIIMRGAMLEAYHKLNIKAIYNRGTSNHIVQDLERSSSDASGKSCSKLLQAFAGVREQG